jgi:predicted enzyme related to lactoylglutathione lyase
MQIMGPVRSLGWIVRFMPIDQMTPVGAFYELGLGLSRVRSFRHAIDWKKQDKDFFWGGECLMLETFYNGLTAATAADGDPARAPLVPIFRTTDLDALLADWATRNIVPVAIETVPNGREAFIRDPAGLLVGFRQIDMATSSQDVEAARRTRRGEAFNPACAAMPAYLQEIGWVRRRLADVAGQRAFYHDVLGLPILAEGDGWAHYDLGDNSILELASGGTAGPTPKAQVATTGVINFRVDDVPALRERVRAAGYAVVHELYSFPRGQLSYFADGEGNMVGVAAMYHPSAYFSMLPPVSEDIEADRRWAETASTA